MLFSLYSGAFLYPALRLEVSLILKPWLLLYLASCYPIFSISKKYGVNNRSSLLYFISLIFAVLLLTMGFAQSGRRKNNPAVYRYSNSVGGDPVSESTFCYKLYSSIFNRHLYRAGRILMPRLTQSPNVNGYTASTQFRSSK